jgi:GDP-L-fucose synthase
MKRVFIAGHSGMVGSAIERHLKAKYDVDIITRTRSKLDLCNQVQVNAFFKNENIDQVYLAAAKVGGIFANNSYPADFIYQNLMIQNNIISAAHKNDVNDLLFLGSSCIYPKLAAQPMEEAALLTGALEPTNEPYAIAKIAGIKMCESYNRQFERNYRSIMPTNLYGENDNFHHETSHVIPALINRFHQAKSNGSDNVLVWGSGRAKREFLHVNDMAIASIFIMNIDVDTYKAQTAPMLSHINVGSGVDCTIRELAYTIAKITKFEGSIIFDDTKPDGAPRKLLDISKLTNLGWIPKIKLEQGLTMTYQWFLENQHRSKDQLQLS